MTQDQIDEMIANNLKTIRKYTKHKIGIDLKGNPLVKKITLKEVAEKILNVKFQQLQKFESGENKIKASQLKLLADFYQIPIQQIYQPINTYEKII